MNLLAFLFSDRPAGSRVLRPRAFVLTLALLVASPLLAQWKTETYQLRGGWNAIYLHGDASHTTPTELFRNYPTVLEVWRWNPNPDQQRFTTDPSDPSAQSNEWTIWKRDVPAEQLLTGMVGQSAYLIRCSGASTVITPVSITQRPQPPSAMWLVSGANFMGFPSDTTGPLFNSFFSTFPVAITTPAKIYKYIGGDLTPANPIQIAPTSERVDRNTAYWFEATTVGDFTAPLHYELPSTNGVAFGRTGSSIVLGIQNRTTTAITLTFSTQNSEPAPTGQTGITGPVPLTRQVYDSATNTYSEVAVVGEFTVTVPASGRMDLTLGLDRTQLTGDSNAVYASLLRVRDSGRFSDVYLPVSAQRATAAGLWIGEATVSSVNSTVAGSPGATTARAFPLRVLIHVANDGRSRLLSQAYVGKLASAGNVMGVALHETSLLESAKSTALRLVSSQMPLDRAIDCNGGFYVGGTVSAQISIPFNDPTNPFVHQYHPDHDNRDARGALYSTGGAESYNLTRVCTFTFTAAPPDGTSTPGWGTSIYGGTYTETITGLNRNPLTVGGTFRLRRVSEIAELTF